LSQPGGDPVEDAAADGYKGVEQPTAWRESATGRLLRLPPKWRNVREEEGTLGAVDCVTFRGVAWKAALKGSSRVSAAGRVGRVPRKGSSGPAPKGAGETELPHGRSAPIVPSGVGHLLATRGVRVDQVGVNPQWRAVAAWGSKRSIRKETATPGLRQPG
jgi:hypothetical protein